MNKNRIIVGMFVYAFILFIIILGVWNIIRLLFPKKPVPDNKPLLEYKVVDVIGIKKHDSHSVTYYAVKINGHEFTMTVSTLHDNVTFKHYRNCWYCKKHNITKHNNFCFSTLDGLTTDLQNKLKRMEENK